MIYLVDDNQNLIEIQVLGITLTDTFGTPAFLNSFKKPLNISELGGFRALASANESTTSSKKADENTDSRVKSEKRPRTYAEVYTGVRQDSGDPAGFVRTMRQFYDSIGVEVSRHLQSHGLEACC